MNINNLIDETNNGVGNIIYFINDINNNFDYIKQRFHTDYNKYNYFMLESSFEIYDKYHDYPIILKDLTTVEKEKLWNIIFDIKKYHYSKYKPDIVTMYLKNKIFSDNRVQKYLSNMNFDECICIQNELSKRIIYYGDINKIDNILIDFYTLNEKIINTLK